MFFWEPFNKKKNEGTMNVCVLYVSQYYFTENGLFLSTKERNCFKKFEEYCGKTF